MAHIVLISFSFRSPRRSYLLYLSSFEHFQVPCAKTNTGEPERTHRKDLDRIKMKSNNLLPHVHSSAARSREISPHQIFRFDKPHSTSCCLPWAEPAITTSHSCCHDCRPLCHFFHCPLLYYYYSTIVLEIHTARNLREWYIQGQFQQRILASDTPEGCPGGCPAR